jgi:Arc/MetJ-type ribon-helix-helix transcriptional regulator
MTDRDVAALDELVADGRFASRSDALRAGFARLLDEERERAIGDAYRRGYGEQPQEEWVGQVGIHGLAELDHAEGGEPL